MFRKKGAQIPDDRRHTLIHIPLASVPTESSARRPWNLNQPKRS